MTSEFHDREFEHAYPNGIEHSFWTKARNAAILDVIRRHGLDQILDVGCGRGLVSDHLFRHGLDVTGVELGPARPLVQSAVPLHFETDARELPADLRARIRTLALFDVLEHVEEPSAFLDELLAALPQVEVIVCTVPARQELWSNYDVFYGHHRRYDRARLSHLFEQVGAHVVESRYLFHTLYIALRGLGLLGREREVSLKPPPPRARALHRVVARLFSLENKLVPGALPGTSLLAVARLSPRRRAVVDGARRDHGPQ
jgi:SAM-dependent methyltransferase